MGHLALFRQQLSFIERFGIVDTLQENGDPGRIDGGYHRHPLLDHRDYRAGSRRQLEVAAILSQEAVANAVRVQDVSITHNHGEILVDTVLIAFEEGQITPDDIAQLQVI
jgi:hypothetical protein